MCTCSTYLGLSYCHHILSVNRLNLAQIILDPTYVEAHEPRRLNTELMLKCNQQNYEIQIFQSINSYSNLLLIHNFNNQS